MFEGAKTIDMSLHSNWHDSYGRMPTKKIIVMKSETRAG